MTAEAQGVPGERLDEELASFRKVSLEELDQRASLLRRVDNEYAVDSQRLLELLGSLRGDHDLLEIEGLRRFHYRSTYFDTGDLRCLIDHVEGREPRFKARTRLYEDTGSCVFEVQLSHHGGSTAQLRSGHVLVETKTEDGGSVADRNLAQMGCESISLSKYRVGMSLVGGASLQVPQPGSELFLVVG